MEYPSNYADLAARIELAALSPSSSSANVALTRIPVTQLGFNLLQLDITPAQPSIARIGLFAGTHGDEPAGVAALLEFIEQRLWHSYPRLAFRVFPCLNPTGFDLRTRENAAGIDMNRQFSRDDTPEVRAVRAAIKNVMFDVTIDAHEDPEELGYYMYAHFENHAWMASIVDAVSAFGPINVKPIVDDQSVVNGVITFANDKDEDAKLREFMQLDEWPLPLFLYSVGSRFSMTTETPGQINLDVRVKMQHAARDRLLQLLTTARAAL